MMAKTEEEKLQELDQKIRKLQTEKKRLQKKKENEERKKRDHAMIVVGSHLLTHFSDDTKKKIIDSSDNEICKWVDSLFKEN